MRTTLDGSGRAPSSAPRNTTMGSPGAKPKSSYRLPARPVYSSAADPDGSSTAGRSVALPEPAPIPSATAVSSDQGVAAADVARTPARSNGSSNLAIQRPDRAQSAPFG